MENAGEVEMDNEREKTDYLDKVQQYRKAHPIKTVGIASVFVLLVVLAIKYNGFVELLKIVFSPQMVICGLVLYFLLTYKGEVSRLIDRIKEVNAWGASIKTDLPIPTPKDKENIPEPEMKVSKTHIDTQFHIGEADSEALQTLKEHLIKADQQANYWF